MPLGEKLVIDGCEVVLVDANHCPGAVQFLFKIPGSEGNFERYVHTGDFRFCDSMKSEPVLLEFIGSDAIFLDTTYCNPKFVFPLQEESIDYIASVVERVSGECKGSTGNVLFLVATYVIGKEKILLEIARRCNRKIYVDARKMSVLRVLGCDESGVFTEDERESDTHVVGWNVLGETWPYFRPNFGKMNEIMVEKGYSKVIGFVPTGWTYEVKRRKFSVRSKDSCEIHLVPYSEHSNYEELREYVKFLKPKRVVPTVGYDVEKVDSQHANKMKKHFAGLVDEMANKQEFLRGFRRGNGETSDKVEKYTGNVPSKELHLEKETKSSNMDAEENIDIGCLSEPSMPLQDCGLQDLKISTDEEAEKTLQELRECLPSWVTREQMLDLIGSSSGGIVEAVSTFYERETEFHEQVFACSTSNTISEISLPNDSAPLLQSATVKMSPFGKIDTPSSQACKSVGVGKSLKSGVSPSKRKKNTETKQYKKVKIKPGSETSGSKQSTITKFFSKVLPNASSGADRTLHEKTPKDEKLPCDDSQPYKNEINQFIQIINASESLESYAATVLEKTKGDINMALEIHYNNTGRGVGLVIDKKSVQSQCVISSCTSGKKEVVLEKVGQEAELSLKLFSTEDVDATSVALLPEKYNPVEHGWCL